MGYELEVCGREREVVIERSDMRRTSWEGMFISDGKPAIARATAPAKFGGLARIIHCGADIN